MADESALLHAIAAEPDADGPRQVYADWLDERGRGEDAERVRLGLAAAADPEDHELAQAALDACASDGLLEALANPTAELTYHRGEACGLALAVEADGAHMLDALASRAPMLRSLEASLAGGSLDLAAWRERLPALREVQLDGDLDWAAAWALGGLESLGLELPGAGSPSHASALATLASLLSEGLGSLALTSRGGASLEGRRLACPRSLRSLTLYGMGAVELEPWPALSSLSLVATRPQSLRTLPGSLTSLSVDDDLDELAELRLPRLEQLSLGEDAERLLPWAATLPRLSGLMVSGPGEGAVPLSCYETLGHIEGVLLVHPEPAALDAYLASAPGCKDLMLILADPPPLDRLEGLAELESFSVIFQHGVMPGQLGDLLVSLGRLPRLRVLRIEVASSGSGSLHRSLPASLRLPALERLQLELAGRHQASAELLRRLAPGSPRLVDVRLPRDPDEPAPALFDEVAALPPGIRLWTNDLTLAERAELQSLAPTVRIHHTLPGRRLLPPDA